MLPAILLTACAITAQAGEVELQAGMKAGMNISTSTGASADSDQSISGIIGGGFVSINLSKWISLQPELLFTQKGSKIDRQLANFGQFAHLRRDFHDKIAVCGTAAAGEVQFRERE